MQMTLSSSNTNDAIMHMDVGESLQQYNTHHSACVQPHQFSPQNIRTNSVTAHPTSELVTSPTHNSNNVFMYSLENSVAVASSNGGLQKSHSEVSLESGSTSMVSPKSNEDTLMSNSDDVRLESGLTIGFEQQFSLNDNHGMSKCASAAAAVVPMHSSNQPSNNVIATDGDVFQALISECSRSGHETTSDTIPDYNNTILSNPLHRREGFTLVSSDASPADSSCFTSSTSGITSPAQPPNYMLASATSSSVNDSNDVEMLEKHFDQQSVSGMTFNMANQVVSFVLVLF